MIPVHLTQLFGDLMEQRLSMITLGVADLQESKQFYEQVVGWNSAHGPEGIAFFSFLNRLANHCQSLIGMPDQVGQLHLEPGKSTFGVAA